MSVMESLSLIRGLVYLWVSLTAFSVFQLYSDGYRIAKKESRIICSLMRILLWVSVVFGYYSVSSITQAFDLDAHEIMASLSPIIVLPLGFLLTKFREESTSDETTKKIQSK